MEKLRNFIKNEAVLIISFVLAAVSAFIVNPNPGYIDYIDFRTLSLLFCLMAVMAGFNKLGIFKMLASRLLSFASDSRSLCLILSLLCFFSSMIITNDVALITFVPFSVIILALSDRVKRLELNTPQRSDFRPIEAFFSSPYESMPSEKKHSVESKLRPFRCFAVLKEQIFVTARRKSARNTRLFQRFSTKLWRKYAFQNRLEFESFHSKSQLLIPLVTLETVAANLGSMLTPIGNPQNLYLFSSFGMKTADFFRILLPYAVLSLILTVISAFFIKKEKLEFTPDTRKDKTDIRLCAVYCVLFAAALLTVFRVIPFEITLAVSVVAILIFDRKTFAKIDYSLLLTFTFLFIFIGNLKNIAPVSDFLRSVVNGNEVIAGVAASQVFSNVPAALLLSGFTENIGDLLIGVNLGGLGTLIASMASLISFKYVVKENVSSGKYILVFTAVNIVYLIFNLALWAVIK